MEPNTPDDLDNTAPADMQVDIHDITPDMLGALGMGQIAYIRTAEMPSGQSGIAIHAANGDVLGFVETEALARAAALQNDLDAFSVH